MNKPVLDLLNRLARQEFESEDGGYDVGVDGPDFAYEAGLRDGETQLARKIMKLLAESEDDAS